MPGKQRPGRLPRRHLGHRLEPPGKAAGAVSRIQVHSDDFGNVRGSEAFLEPLLGAYAGGLDGPVCILQISAAAPELRAWGRAAARPLRLRFNGAQILTATATRSGAIPPDP